MSLLKRKFFKSFLALAFLSLVMVVLVGCGKDDKIELTLETSSYEIKVDDEIEVVPTITKGKDVGEVKLVYSTEDEEIATYINGKIKGVAVGETKVKVAVDGRETVFKEITVKVNPLPTYTITYNLNGGTNASANVGQFTKDNLPITLAEPTKEDHVFLGWFTKADFSGQAVTTINREANVTLYAKWEEVKYTITYNLNEGTLPNDVKSVFTKAELDLDLPVPTRDGFKFLGWFVAEDFSGAAVTEITEAKDTILFAKWEEEEKPHKSMEIEFEVPAMVEGDVKEVLATITGNDDLGRKVKTLFTIPEGLKLEAFLGEEWKVITDYLAGDQGFPLKSESFNFRITALNAGKFDVMITVTDVDADEVIYEKTIEVVVEEKAEEYTTVLEAREASVGTELTVKGIITAVLGNNIFLQDGTAAIYVYLGNDASFNDKFAIGNEIVVSAKRAVFNQLVQLGTVTEVTVLKTEVELPTILTYEELDLEALLTVESQRVSIEGLTVLQVPNIGSGSYSVTVSQGEKIIDIRVDAAVNGYNDIKALFQGLVIGQQIDVKGILVGRFHANVQLTLTDIDQIVVRPISKELVEAILEEKLNPGQNVTEDLVLKATFEIAGVEYQITWTSNNVDVITNDGTVVRPEIGQDDVNVVLTAKTAFGEEEITLSFEVTVLAKRDTSDVVTYVETFDNFPATSNNGNNYDSGTFVGVNNIEWEFNGLRSNLDVYEIDGKSAMFGNAAEHKGGASMLKATISGGIGDFKVDTLKAYTGSGIRTLGLFINGELIEEFTLDNSKENVQVFEIKNINVSGTFTFELRQTTPGTSRAQITIDNLTWTTFE